MPFKKSLLIPLCVVLVAHSLPGQEKKKDPFPRKTPAPSLSGGIDWINTSGPITLDSLKGKVVLLDFWTYCCINCMHVLPDLKKLEHKYPNQLVVIGVHSAKFDEEKDSQNIREAVLRYEIEHPVVNDAEMRIWQKYAVRSWPTLWLIDPEGNAVGYVSGEGNYDGLDKAIGALVDYHRDKGTLNEAPVRFELEEYQAKPTPLRFPGKVLVDPKGQRVFVSDSNHNRIVIASSEGKLLDIIGSGTSGRDDGAFDEATLFRPQGMVLDGDTLLIADTENHVLRSANLQSRELTTVAGTGVQGYSRSHDRSPAATTALNSPWDLWIHQDLVFIAMAGPHQIWVWDRSDNTVRAYAGSGREDIIDGPLKTSALAQPSGLSSDGKFLYVADSEGSSIRAIPFDSNEEVDTILGSEHLPNNRLFAYDDIDGGPRKARFQHPLGVSWKDGQLFVADTYNNKIKVIDLETRVSRTLFGSRKPGVSNDPPQFDEPSGLHAVGDELYVADTNNHAVRIANLKTKEVRNFQIEGLSPPKVSSNATDTFTVSENNQLKAQFAKPGIATELKVTIRLRTGYKLNPKAPMRYKVESVDNKGLVTGETLGKTQRLSKPELAWTVPLRTSDKTGTETLRVSVTYFPCQIKASGICEIKTVSFDIPVKIEPAARSSTLELKINDAVSRK